MIAVKLLVIFSALYVQQVISLANCWYYKEDVIGVVTVSLPVPTFCPDYCCTNSTSIRTSAAACCGKTDLGLWWIAIGCAIALVVCLIILCMCCCCGCCTSCLKCLVCPCC